MKSNIKGFPNYHISEDGQLFRKIITVYGLKWLVILKILDIYLIYYGMVI